MGTLGMAVEPTDRFDTFDNSCLYDMSTALSGAQELGESPCGGQCPSCRSIDGH